jgi:hypothetical protein
MGTTLMNSAWASLQRSENAIYGYSGMQRSIRVLPLSFFMWLECGSEGQAGL